MGKRKKQTDEERLLKKRIAEKKRQERIKNNPDLLLQEKLKRHLKYDKQKKKGVVKPIDKMSTREKRAQRKKWKENSSRYRQNQRLLNVADRPTPPSSNDEESDDVREGNLLNDDIGLREGVLLGEAKNDGRKLSGRKKIRKDRSKAYRRIKELESELKKTKSSREKYKKRYYRLKNTENNTKTNLTPKSKTKAELKDFKVSKEIRKRLFFANVIESQLTENYKNLNSVKSRQMFTKMISGKVIQKYRCLAVSKSFLKYKNAIKNIDSKKLIYERKLRGEVEQLKEIIREYLEKDENSRLCPGKKDCLTRLKEKKQKRFLNGSLKDLYEKYLKENQKKCSYSTFCKYKPFWVVEPRVDSRDTCLCVTHENMKLITEKLHSYGVLNSKSPREVLKEMTCNSECKQKCMLKKCKNCQNKKISFNVFEENENIQYNKWITRTETRDIRGKQKLVKIISKETLHVNMGEMISDFQQSAPKFMIHLENIKHQSHSLTELKMNLGENDVVIHIDFSENYNCKYSSEAQAMHFGASREQITMHTGVFYFKEDDKLIPKSFCSMSQCLRHDSAAMWAHLIPVLEKIFSERQIEMVHFFSDSPTSQYRNKTNFHLLAKVLPSMYPAIKFVTWNFGEAGHGKGAPDGVGGVLKRTADKIVAHGKDLATFSDVFTALKGACTRVELFHITVEEIESLEKQHLTNYKLEPFKGTMKVHQALIDFKSPRTIHFRSLSCNCPIQIKCEHDFDLGKIKTVRTSKDDGDDDIPTQSSSEEPFQIKPGDWVIVKYDKKLYPGEILSMPSSAVLEVNTMEPATAKTFKWPNKKDILFYNNRDVVKKIGPPEPCGSRASQFKFVGFP